MKRLACLGTLCIACWHFFAGAQAQVVYRCGSAYGHTPCEGGLVVQVEDHRSPAQKADTDHAAAQDAKLANEMEHARLHRETGTRAHAPAHHARPAPKIRHERSAKH